MVSGGHIEQPSVTGRSTVPMNDPVYNLESGYYGMPSAVPPPSPGRHAPPPNHNQVDIMRIRLGLDVRTTVSLLPTHGALSSLTLVSDYVAKHPQ